MSTTKDGETGGNTKHEVHRSKFDALPPNLIPLGLRREAAAAYWRTLMGKLCKKHGTKRVKQLLPRHVRSIRDALARGQSSATSAN